MADVSTVTQQIRSDPEVQAFLHQIQGTNPELVHSIPYLMSVVPGLVQKLSPNAQALINSVPQDYVWDWQSQSLKQKPFNDRHPWFLPAVALGTAGLTMGMVPGVPGVPGMPGGSSVGTDVTNTAAQSLTPAASSGSYIGSDVASTASAASGGHGILGSAANVLLGRGTGNTALDTAGRVGRGLLGIEADRQAGRESEAQATQAQDRNAIAAANVNLTAGSRRGAQSVQGDVMANAQPFKWTGDNQMVGNIPVPQFSGGVSPALFSDNTRKLGGELSADALASQTADHGSPVNLTPLPQGSATDSILSTAGRIGGLLSMIPYKRPQAPVPTGWA